MTRPVPTVRLHSSDRAAVLSHFVALDSEDRRLRFGSPIADEGIESYVSRVDFAHDGLFAVHDDRLAIVALVHIATSGDSAELGLSVLPDYRGAGCGNALLRRAVTWLRNRGVREVFVHCLSENGAMMHLARRNGMRIVAAGGESDAHLALDAATADSFITEWLEDQRGLAIRTLRQNARTAEVFFAGFSLPAAKVP